MNHTPSLSVIIPVYKVASYLEQCIESVLQQTLKNIEIILVDDGSPDTCPALCDAYACKDPRIRVIHQDNLGLAGARNTGLRYAIGDYVAFLDSDDYVEPDAYAKLYDAANTHGADIAFCQARYFDDTAGAVVEVDDSSCLPLFREKRFSNGFSWQDIGVEKIFSYDSFVVAWNKICRRNFLAELGANFPVGLIYEDNPFYFQTIFAATRLCVVHERLVTYRINRIGSIIQDVDGGEDARAMHILAILADTEQRLQSLGVGHIISAFHRYAFTEVCHKYPLVPQRLRPKYIALAKRLLPPRLYGKLRLRFWARAVKKARLSCLLSLQCEWHKGSLVLFDLFPLVSVYKYSHAPGEYNGKVLMGDKSSTDSILSAANVDSRILQCQGLTLTSLMDNLSELVSKPAFGVPIYSIRSDDLKKNSLCSSEIASVCGFLTIAKYILFIDRTPYEEVDLAKLRNLYFRLNCIFAESWIQFALPEISVLHKFMRYMNFFDKNCSGSDVGNSKLARFNRYVVVKVLGFPLIVGRRT